MTISRRTLIRSTAGLGVLSLVPPGAARSQPRANLYDCEGCEALHEVDPATLSSSAAISGPNEPGERLILSGTVFAVDGRTPAAGIVIYLHQTNAAGVYAGGTNESGWSRRHGRLRGWVRTGANGVYEFRTVKPAPYPNANLPAHIHLMILERRRRPYWIDDVVFEGEFGVTDAYRKARTNQGGNGIVKLGGGADGVWLARRDIFLERHPN